MLAPAHASPTSPKYSPTSPLASPTSPKYCKCFQTLFVGETCPYILLKLPHHQHIHQLVSQVFILFVQNLKRLILQRLHIVSNFLVRKVRTRLAYSVYFSPRVPCLQSHLSGLVTIKPRQNKWQIKCLQHITLMGMIRMLCNIHISQL